MRFDYGGMGDSPGSMRTFDEIGPDIAAAIDALLAACPGVEQVVLWGLCDAASAALTYWHATRDARVAGMVLLNPWVRSEASIATTRIKHYYGQHLLEKEFWSRLFRGRVDVVRAVRDFAANLVAGRAKGGENAANAVSTFQDRMAEGLSTFAGPVLVILSGRDLTAREFVEYAQSSPRWTGLLGRPNLVRHDIRAADHTFSSAQWRGEVEAQTLDWLRQSFSSAPR
jgi:exosortase A-associated hydrolase 1